MLPEDICNMSLAAAGAERWLGDIRDGSPEANACLRHYGSCMRQLMRAAHWDFLRKTAPLLMLADVTGQTPNVGTQVPVPWTYEYAYPADCMQARFIPQNNFALVTETPASNISAANGNLPLLGAGAPPTNAARIIPSRFTIATDWNYPVQVGQPPAWGEGVEWWNVQGVGPQERTVILSNVNKAQLVYTAFLPYPSLWDPQFIQAMVSLLASYIAMPLNKDKKVGLAIQASQIAIAKQKLEAARITDGNEMWATNDLVVDWLRIRNSGESPWGWFGPATPGPLGVLGYSWDSCGFANGSCY